MGDIEYAARLGNGDILPGTTRELAEQCIEDVTRRGGIAVLVSRRTDWTRCTEAGADAKPVYPSLGRLIREASACIGWSYNREADRRPRLDALDGLAHESVREVLRGAVAKLRAAGVDEAADLIDPDKEPS